MRKSPFEEPDDDRSPRVCWCMKVHEATIERAIRAGHDTLDAVRTATRAMSGCGTCRPDVEALLQRFRAPSE